MAAESSTENVWLEWTKAVAMPLATVVATGFVTWVVDSATKEREASEAKQRLYAQLLAQREHPEASMRKELYDLVAKQFLRESGKRSSNWQDRLLQLELLAGNFSQTFDIAPLFKDMAHRLRADASLGKVERLGLATRLDRTASALLFKQIDSLVRHGGASVHRFAGVGRWEDSIGTPLIRLTDRRTRLTSKPAGDNDVLEVLLEIIDVSFDRREVEFRLRADLGQGPEHEIDRHFWVGRYDFPMLDNIQLGDGLRAAVAITSFDVPDRAGERRDNSFASIHLVVFPATAATLRDRQDYDDVIINLLGGHQTAGVERRSR